MLPADHPAVMRELVRRQEWQLKQQQLQEQRAEDDQHPTGKRRKKDKDTTNEPEAAAEENEVKDTGKWKSTHLELAEKRVTLRNRNVKHGFKKLASLKRNEQ